MKDPLDIEIILSKIERLFGVLYNGEKIDNRKDFIENFYYYCSLAKDYENGIN